MPDYEGITSTLNEFNKLIEESIPFTREKVIEIARELFLCYPQKNIQLHDKLFSNNDKVKHFLPDLDDKCKDETEKKCAKNLVIYLLKWIDFTAVFLFGYIIFQICSKIEEEEKNGYPIEQELWVTSHWDFLVNKVLHETRFKKNEDKNEENNRSNSLSYLNHLLQQKEQQ